MTLAWNAKPILDARLKGFKPDGLTIVSLTGQVDTANHVVRAMPGMAYDWRWVHGLEVCVYVDIDGDWVDTVKSIALRRPSYLCIWSPAHRMGVKVYLIPTADDIEKPPHEWGYELDFLEWMDFENEDFIVGRTYLRNEGGIPYALNP